MARAREAEELAERLGDETEAAFARGLGAVASASVRQEAGPEGREIREAAGPGVRETGGLESVDGALRELRALDSLWTIGHVQAYVAEVELERGRRDAAGERAEEAAQAARTLDQPSLLALARSLLARCAVLDGSADEAAAHLESLEAARTPHLLSHRARWALRRARQVAGR